METETIRDEIIKMEIEEIVTNNPSDDTDPTANSETAGEPIPEVITLDVGDEQQPIESESFEYEDIDDFDCEISEIIEKLLLESKKYLTSPSVQVNLNIKSKPSQITGAWHAFSSKSNNYTKGCKWAPDGSCVLTNSEDQCLRLFDLPSELSGYSQSTEIDCSKFHQLNTSLRIEESGLIYDYAWYPLMNSSNPVSCCLLSTCKGQPIHLWDAFTGVLRSTYKPYDHLDEVVAAHSLAFDPFGQHIYSGFNKMIRVFDIAIPGREFREFPTKDKKEGQSGIISCIAVNPANHRIIAAGSYCKTIGLFLESRGDRLCVLAGQRGGVTHLAFSPDGNRLFSGGRKDPEILCWDIRNPGKILSIMRRYVTTNQRMYFDISKDGKYIVSGNSNGVVTIWDSTKPGKEVAGFEEPILDPLEYFPAHDDCVNGASFHPYFPLLATSSGQRKFPTPLDSDSDDDDELENKEDNSLRFWWFS